MMRIRNNAVARAIAKDLRLVRRMLDIYQKDAGAAIGVTQATVCNIERLLCVTPAVSKLLADYYRSYLERSSRDPYADNYVAPADYPYILELLDDVDRQLRLIE